MPADPDGLLWVLTRPALAAVAADRAAREVLAAGRVHVLTRRGRPPVAGLEAVPAASFGSFAAMAAAALAGDLPEGAGALLYDPEHWPFTPPEEQRDVAGHVVRAAALARSLGLLLIAAPAVTLTEVLVPRRRRRQDRYDAYLAAGIPAMAAAADVVDVQAQGAEREPRRYAEVVAGAAAQVHAANPRALVIAGLSTNPPGDPVDAAMLARAIEVSRPLVAGYWLNVPARGPHCPTCNPPRPDVGIAALRAAFS